MTHHLDLDTVTLDKGAHDTRTDGVCVMEAAAWYAAREHLQPTVDVLQSSAIDLYKAMIRPGEAVAS